jgi:DNA recombination protein RmuC
MQIATILLCLIACGIGVSLGWLVGVRREREAHGNTREELAGLRARLDAERTAADEKVAALQDFEANVKDSFQSLAAAALDANAQRLLDLNRQELEKQKTAVSTDLSKKELSIANMLGPMKDSLQQLTEHSQKLEVQREGAYTAILAEVKNIQQSHMDLRRETTQLVQALRAPKVRGNWGEMQLRRCVEYSGMVEHASFDVEKFVRGDDISVRPDLIVRLPNQRSIVIDAKTPLDAFMNAGACEDEVLRQGHMRDHANAVRKHLDSLSSKAYWNYFKESPDFVVCFLPSEVLFSAALEQDPTLLEHSANAKVLLATPTTLIALLKAVAYGWSQEQTARDAKLIEEIANKIHAKLVGLHKSFVNLGSALKSAGDHYDAAIGQAEGRGGVFSIARELHELSIGKEDLKELKPIAVAPRLMQHKDWQSGLAIAASGETPADPADLRD